MMDVLSIEMVMHALPRENALRLSVWEVKAMPVIETRRCELTKCLDAEVKGGGIEGRNPSKPVGHGIGTLGFGERDAFRCNGSDDCSRET